MDALPDEQRAIVVGVPQRRGDEDAQAVGGDGGAEGDDQAVREPTHFAREVPRKREVETQKTNDEEVDAGAYGTHYQVVCAADESRALLIDEIDASNQPRQPGGRREDPEE